MSQITRENPNYQKLIGILEEVFQLNQADLDFGIYRIMNHRRERITEFMRRDLIPQVKAILREELTEDKSEVQTELDKLTETLTGAGMNPDDSPKVQALRAQLTGATDIEAEENQVFGYLATFFRRYYDGGDFISLRRYKKDTYAIPYEGEEVKLYWANHDQYYIKTSEYLKNYAFKINDGARTIRFTLREAGTEQNNNKATAGKERRFALYTEEPLTEADGELQINFTYELTPKKTKQADLLRDAFETLKTQLPADYQTELLQRRPTPKKPERTLLEKHLRDYTARNTFDYFIHKDLGGFLRRELDFFIKNEVLHLDDIGARDAAGFVRQLSKIRALKEIGGKVIDFLAQLEDFQKKLWLKKKFVTDTQYCLTLDRIPESFYAEIAANDAQRKEWETLFHIQDIQAAAGELFTTSYSVPLTEAFLKENPFLVLDTQFFSTDFKDRLVATLDNLDEQLDGLLINSENFQALNLLQERYREEVQCVYIDPPYNTASDRDEGKFIYKDGFASSSWLALMRDRIAIGKKFLESGHPFFMSIDDNEVENLKILSHSILGKSDFIGQYNWFKSATPPSLSKKIKKNLEYILCYEKNKGNGKFYGIRKFSSSTDPLNKKQNGISRLTFKPNSLCTKMNDCVIKEGTYGTSKYPNILLNDLIIKDGTNFNEVTFENRFVWTQDNLCAELKKKTKIYLSDKLVLSYKKNEYDAETPPNLIDSSVNVKTTENAGSLLVDIFGREDVFDYPKHPTLLEYLIDFQPNRHAVIFDYFAGSGTTAHSVINLNRKDQGKRKYLMVDMGDYFNEVIKPRVQKVIYSPDWKDGKPVSRAGSSHAFKYLRLESYEDTLNNLKPTDLSPAQQENLQQSARYREGYLLQYMLDTELRDSLLDTDRFADPFNYYLDITRTNETTKTRIDLVETFNYLIGLRVARMHILRGFRVVEGTTRAGERTLVIWRNVHEKSNDDLNEFFLKQQYSTRDAEFDRIYVNGDNNLENLRTEEERWKVVLTEEAFTNLMFGG